MPRGGGGFGGGGFGGGRGGGGGGFGGGGFRGGGHRGSSGGFRSGSSGSHPFGRTGANRNVSRPPRGNNYYGRHGGRYGRYGYGRWGYGGYYRPWYGRHYWFWGRPYGSWYYSPVYVGGGFILFLLLLLLIIPLIGLFAVPYPASSSQTVTYNDTKTINFNEYWYESEYLSAGNTIDYQAQGQEPISFAIWDQSFDKFPVSNTGGNTGSATYSFNVNTNEDYQYVTYYLYQGDTLNYNFTLNGDIEFFIADGPNLQRWNNYESAQLIDDSVGSSAKASSFTAPHSQDWYLVWYNSATTGSPVTVSVGIQYSISSIDMSNANVHVLNTYTVTPATFTVPTSGTYYFFIYFDPTTSAAEKTDISFTVVYHKNLTSNDNWKQSSPLITFFVIIIIILLVVAIVQRNNAKKYEKQRKEQETTAQTPSTTSQTAQISSPSGQSVSSMTTSTSGSTGKKRCQVCGTAYFDTDVYCTSCGTKLIGRDYGVPTKTTPSGSSNCSVCGTHLDPNSRFCPDCGTQVK